MMTTMQLGPNLFGMTVFTMVAETPACLSSMLSFLGILLFSSYSYSPWLRILDSNVFSDLVTILFCFIGLILSQNLVWAKFEGGAGIAQWWGCTPPTIVAQVWFLDPAPYVSWVCCWIASLHRRVFSKFSSFPSSTSTCTITSKFQFDLDSVAEKPLCGASAYSILFTICYVIVVIIACSKVLFNCLLFVCLLFVLDSGRASSDHQPSNRTDWLEKRRHQVQEKWAVPWCTGVC